MRMAMDGANAEGARTGGQSIFASVPAPGQGASAEVGGKRRVDMGGVPGQTRAPPQMAVRPDRPALTQIGGRRNVRKVHKAVASHVADRLGGLRFLDWSPDVMRQPAPPGQTALGDRGENLSGALQALCETAHTRVTLLAWTCALAPAQQVAGLEFPKDPDGRVGLAIRERTGRRVSSAAASDGLLRLLGLLAVLLAEDASTTYVLDGIERGIHPTRMAPLVELIEGAAERGVQVIATTHAPDLLAMVGEPTFLCTSVVCRNPGAESAVIRPVPTLPHAERLRRTQGLGKLHATGWMEDILHFSQEGAA